MPPDQGVGLDDRQSLPPGEQFGQQHQGQPGGILCTPRLDLAIQVKSPLLAQEKVFGGNCVSRAQGETDEFHGIQQ
jgi:hypothetical protein